MANDTPLDKVLGWLHKGYPEGVPPTDYYPLLALLRRSLTEEEVTLAILEVFKEHGTDNPISRDQIREGISRTTEVEPQADEVNQVAARLASVGWPLAHG